MTVVEPPNEAGRLQGDLEPAASDADVQRQSGEPFRRVPDLGALHPGSDVPALYERLDLSALAGQAVVSLTHMARLLLVVIDPAGCRLRMVERRAHGASAGVAAVALPCRRRYLH